MVRVEQGSIEWHQKRKIAADLFSGINYNTKNFRKKFILWTKPIHFNPESTQKTRTSMYHNLLTRDFFAFGAAPMLQTLFGVNMYI